MSWRETTLGEITNLKRGFDLPKSQRLQGDVPVYSSSGITGSNSTAAVEGPCVITGRYGTIGEVFFSGGPCWPLNTALYSTEFNGNNPRFVYYLLQTIPWQGYTTASAVPGVNRNHVNLCPVKIPDRATQDAIVEVLDSIVDKIALNNRLNDYLANLLDAAFANSAKSGSKEFGLPEVVDILSGGTPKTKNAEYWEDGRIPFFTPGDVTNSVYTLTTEKHITDVGLDNCNSELYPVDTVFLTARGTVGKVAIAGRPMAMNQSCFAFRGKSIPQSVVFQIIKNAVKTLRAKANGATFAAINTRDLKIETVAVPCNKEIAHYDESASKWLDLIRTNEEENLQLSALRDILLPKLMSGEIDVSKVDLTQLTNNHLAGRMHWSNVIRVRAIHAVHSQQSQIPAYESVPKVSHSPCRTALTLGGIAPLLSWLAVSQFTAQSFAMLVVFCQVVLCGVSSELS